MQRRRALAALVLSGLCLLAPARAGQPQLLDDRLRFELTDLEGKRVTADDPRFAGKVMLVDLWGTWCPPCLSQIPVYARLQEEHGDAGLVVVGIAFERRQGEEKDRLLAHARRDRGINYLVLDGGTPDQVEEKLPGLSGFKGFPVEILVGRDGVVRVVRNGKGYSKRWERKLREEVEALLAEE